MCVSHCLNITPTGDIQCEYLFIYGHIYLISVCLFLKFCFIYMSVCVGVHMHRCLACGVQKSLSEPQALELWVVVRYLARVLGTKVWFSMRAANTLNCWALSPGPICITFSQSICSDPLPFLKWVAGFLTIVLGKVRRAAGQRGQMRVWVDAMLCTWLDHLLHPIVFSFVKSI